MTNPGIKLDVDKEDLKLYNSTPKVDSDSLGILGTNVNNTLANNLNEKDSSSKSFEDENEESLQNGRWNQDEHLRFIKGCLYYGNNWKKVKKYVKTRSSAQIRSHAQKYLIKLGKKYKPHEHLKSTDSPSKQTELSPEVVEKIMNSDSIQNVEMDVVERAILSIFKSANNERGFQGSDIDVLNFKIDPTPVKKERTVTTTHKKERIFNLTKIPKEKKKEIELLEKKSNTGFFNYEKDKNAYNKLLDNYNYMGYDSIDKKNEDFINNCLDSRNIEDLLKLFIHFNNEVAYNANSMQSSNYLAQQYYYQNQQNQQKEKDLYDTLKQYVVESYGNSASNGNTTITGSNTNPTGNSINTFNTAKPTSVNENEKPQPQKEQTQPQESPKNKSANDNSVVDINEKEKPSLELNNNIQKQQIPSILPQIQTLQQMQQMQQPTSTATSTSLLSQIPQPSSNPSIQSLQNNLHIPVPAQLQPTQMQPNQIQAAQIQAAQMQSTQIPPTQMQAAQMQAAQLQSTHTQMQIPNQNPTQNTTQQQNNYLASIINDNPNKTQSQQFSDYYNSQLQQHLYPSQAGLYNYMQGFQSQNIFSHMGQSPSQNDIMSSFFAQYLYKNPTASSLYSMYNNVQTN